MSLNHRGAEELPCWNVVGQNYIILRRIQPTGDRYKDKEEGDCLIRRLTLTLTHNTITGLEIIFG